LEGQLEGQMVLLQRLLEKRFGILPTWALKRLQHAEREQLEQWSWHVLEATALEQVFGVGE
jgi:hypothetical protein